MLARVSRQLPGSAPSRRLVKHRRGCSARGGVVEGVPLALLGQLRRELGSRANNARRSSVVRSARPALEVPRNGIAAHRDARAGESSSKVFPSGTEPHHRQDFGDGIDLSREGQGKTRQPLGKHRANADRHATSALPNSELCDRANDGCYRNHSAWFCGRHNSSYAARGISMFD